MLKKSGFLVAFFVIVGCFVPHVADAYTKRGTAIIQIMNKAAGKVRTVSVPVGQSVNFEKIDITVRACMQTGPFEAENFYAFTEITKSGDTRFFSNWMDRNNPGRNPVQNPDYDVWLVRCE